MFAIKLRCPPPHLLKLLLEPKYDLCDQLLSFWVSNCQTVAIGNFSWPLKSTRLKILFFDNRLLYKLCLYLKTICFLYSLTHAVPASTSIFM